MLKPKQIGGYQNAVTVGCERVLVTLLRGLGPFKASVFLVGGLTPRYLVRARPPAVPAHAGTGDLDVVIDVSILADVDAYHSLEENLHRMGFERGVNNRGAKVSWRWETKLETGATMILELLADAADLVGGKVKPLPNEEEISALSIAHASIVFDLHDQIDVTAELLGENGQATETIRYANLVGFTVLKTFAFADRAERKDAHDLTYVIEHADGGLGQVLGQFRSALEGPHRDVVLEALALLEKHFCDDAEGEGYRKDGSVMAARFELGDDDGEEDRDTRLLRQRRISEAVSRLIAGLRP